MAVACAGVLVARSSLADHYRVPTGSMRPNVVEGDRIIVDKLAYGLRVLFTHLRVGSHDGPARGDAVVLDSPEDGRVLLKRAAAVPGDRVAVRHGEVLLDGLPARHTYTLALDHDGGPDLDDTTVPDDLYLVLGDNRGNSHDGRAFGLVSRDAILGRALAVCLRDGGWFWQPL